MKEKLSLRKVYRNAYRYVASHLFAFGFLTVFYFLGSLLAMIFGSFSFKIISFIYTYLFLYFAAGFYFKQTILWDKEVFLRAGMRFLTAVLLFFSAIFVGSLALNFGLYFLHIRGEALAQMAENPLWIVARLLFIFVLFNVFFVIPSFAFVSEITGKSRSLLMTYAKTKGNICGITAVTAGGVVLLVAVMTALTYINVIAAAAARAAMFAFISILYFKMYDFFYNFPVKKREKAPLEIAVDITEPDDAMEIKKSSNQEKNTTRQKTVKEKHFSERSSSKKMKAEDKNNAS